MGMEYLRTKNLPLLSYPSTRKGGSDVRPVVWNEIGVSYTKAGLHQGEVLTEALVSARMCCSAHWSLSDSTSRIHTES
jgi:hypothetical protein